MCNTNRLEQTLYYPRAALEPTPYKTELRGWKTVKPRHDSLQGFFTVVWV